jgi:DNA-binding winged helix-turn-helix (wHTH) protein
MSDHHQRIIYQSGDCEVDLARRELRTRGIPVPVGSRAFDIIETLVRSAGDLVTKDDLMERVWSGAIVEENTIQVHISAATACLAAGSHSRQRPRPSISPRSCPNKTRRFRTISRPPYPI